MSVCFASGQKFHCPLRGCGGLGGVNIIIAIKKVSNYKISYGTGCKNLDLK
jgi:hypothetical protein